MKRLFTILCIALLGWTIADTPAQRKRARERTVQLQDSKDATLVESPEGVLANSEGGNIFVGRTGQNKDSIRRGLIAFDLSRAIPARSRIISATLTMKVQFSGGGDKGPIDLYRTTRFWKEGTSVGEGGPGVKAQPGDPTWIYSVFDTTRWSRPGGEYVEESSAKAEGSDDVYTWNSTPKLVADVQAWVNSPKTNFGWILIGDESEGAGGTAKVFFSRESKVKTAQPPQLTVAFRPAK
jgi:hypothetical protein